MPVEIIENTDSLTSMVQFRTSLVYEMLVSLHTLGAGGRHLDWAVKAHNALGDDFWHELDTCCMPYEEGTVLFELAVDYQDLNDVTGFIDYVRQMNATTFVFYFIGRIIPIDELHQANLNVDFIIQRLTDFAERKGHIPFAYTKTVRQMLADISGYQARLVVLWERYWREFFQGQLSGLSERWALAISDKQHIVAHRGGRALLDFVTGRTTLPENLPDDQPVREIAFIPVYYTTAPSYVFYGYGSVTVLFNSEATQAHLSEIEEGKNQALAVARLLSDDTRLDILRLVAQRKGHLNGKSMAEKLGLSPSTVSRQLAQLRDSGLLIEEKHDDQSVSYSLVPDVITRLPGKILDYLYEG